MYLPHKIDVVCAAFFVFWFVVFLDIFEMEIHLVLSYICFSKIQLKSNHETSTK